MSSSDETALTAADLAAASCSCAGQLALGCWLVPSYTSGQLKIDSDWRIHLSLFPVWPASGLETLQQVAAHFDCGFWESELLRRGGTRRWSGEMFHIGHQMKTLPINSSSRDQVHIIEINLKAWLLWESKYATAEFQNRKIILWHFQNSPPFHLLNYHLSGCFITCLDLLCSGVKTEAWQRVLICHIKSFPANWRRFKNLETASWATLNWNVLWYFDALWRLEQKAKYWPHSLLTEINRVCSEMSKM